MVTVRLAVSFSRCFPSRFSVNVLVRFSRWFSSARRRFSRTRHRSSLSCYRRWMCQITRKYLRSGQKTKGLWINESDGRNQAVFYAAWEGRVDVLEWLKMQGADVNIKDDHGRTPMSSAANEGQLDAMKWMQTQGVDVNAKDHNGGTLMFYAAAGGHVNVMEWLKEEGVDINARDNIGRAALTCWSG